MYFGVLKIYIFKHKNVNKLKTISEQSVFYNGKFEF